MLRSNIYAAQHTTHFLSDNAGNHRTPGQYFLLRPENK
jgi:hypothetical protein